MDAENHPEEKAPEPLRVLILEDNRLDADLALRELKKGGFATASAVVETAEAFTREVRANRPDVILADYNLPQWTGLEALEILHREEADIPLILVTGSLGDVKAVECIKQGVTDYVLKDQLTRLAVTVRRALKEQDLRAQGKRSEVALHESQAQFQTIVESAMDAIISVDEEERIVLFNGAAQKMFRCSLVQAMGMPVTRFISESEPGVGGIRLKNSDGIGTGERAAGQLRHLRGRREDGGEFPMEASVSQTYVGEGRLFTIILRDVTERKLAEQELAEKVEELARSNSDLEQFAYVASHDLQEPLRMVAAYTQLLAERYKGKLDDNADKYISYATEGAKRMQTLIQDLLAFSRVGRKGTAADISDCNPAVNEALRNLNAAIQESAAVIQVEQLPQVWAERSQLVQVFQNLIGNAIKFRQKGPPVISIKAEMSGADWLLSVTDNGIGIGQENSDVIFSIFQRLHTRAEYEGNGIGLAVCKKIVERCGGKIWVESQPGHGSTFKFTLPAKAGATSRKEQAAHAASS